MESIKVYFRFSNPVAKKDSRETPKVSKNAKLQICYDSEQSKDEFKDELKERGQALLPKESTISVKTGMARDVVEDWPAFRAHTLDVMQWSDRDLADHLSGMIVRKSCMNVASGNDPLTQKVAAYSATIDDLLSGGLDTKSPEVKAVQSLINAVKARQ